MDHLICPNCQVEIYNFDGEKLACPKCPQDDFMSALYDSEGDLLYRELIKFKSPFFKLELGKKYYCEVSFKDISETIQIIPISYSSKSNKLFFIFGADFIMSKYPTYTDVILKRDFDEIWDDVVLLKKENEKINYPQLTNASIGTTSSQNTIVMHNGYNISNFKVQNKN